MKVDGTELPGKYWYRQTKSYGMMPKINAWSKNIRSLQWFVCIATTKKHFIYKFYKKIL